MTSRGSRSGLIRPEQVEDGVAQDLDLAPAAVAGVDADAVVVRTRAPAGGRRCRRCPRVSGRPGRPPGLRCSSVDTSSSGAAAPPSRVRYRRRPARAASPWHRVPTTAGAGDAAQPPSDRRPGRRQMPRRGPDLGLEALSTAPATGEAGRDGRAASCRDGVEHVEVAGGQAGQPEERESRRERPRARAPPGTARRRSRSRSAGLGSPMRSRSRRHSSNLPGRLVDCRRAVGPPLQHVGTVHRVAVEEVRHVTDAREALRTVLRRARTGPRYTRIAHVLGQGRQPRILEVLLDHLHKGPHGAFGQPRDRCRGACRWPGRTHR